VPKRSELPVTQRREAVIAVLRKDEPLSVVARRYGVSDPTLMRWRDDFLEAGVAALSGKGKSAEDRGEVARLRRELDEQKLVVGELSIANHILKKNSERQY